MGKLTLDMQKKKEQRLEEYALAITRSVGSLASVIIHTLLFVACFVAVWLGLLPFDHMLLVLTTVVSLEAIYLSIFIQMTINYTHASIEGVEQNIDEIQEDIDELQEDVGEIQEDVEEMSEEEKEEEDIHTVQEKTLQEIHGGLQKLIAEVEQLQKK